MRRYTEKSMENLRSLRESFLPLDDHNISDLKPKSNPSEFQLFMVTVKLFFGISYLTMPNTLARTGIIGGIVLFSSVIILNYITMIQLLTIASHHKGIKSYSELGARILSKRGKIIVDVCIWIK